MKYLSLLFMLFFSTVSFGQNTATNESKTNLVNNDNIMKTYVIERIIPGAGNLSAAELKGISQKSCDVLKEMNSNIEWIQSYVTGDKVYCVYKSQNVELINEHAKICGFPANSINQVSTIIGPFTAQE